MKYLFAVLALAGIAYLSYGGYVWMNLSIRPANPLVTMFTWPEKLIKKPTPAPTSDNYVHGDILISFKPGISRVEAEQLLHTWGYKFTPQQSSQEFINTYGAPYKLEVAPGTEFDEIDKLQSYPQIKYAQLNNILHIQSQ